MDISFYGGKQGKSFRIAKIFENKAEMVQDLQSRWNSSIGINEFVFINYGSPTDKTIYKTAGTYELYDQQFTLKSDMTRWEFNRFIDKNIKIPTKIIKNDKEIYEDIADGKLYNTTIWEKCYTSDDELVVGDEHLDPINGMDKYMINDDFGLGYHLVASLTGNTPTVSAESEWKSTDSLPVVSSEYDEKDVEHIIFNFDLPKGITFLCGEKLKTKNELTTTIVLTDDETTVNLEKGIKFGTGDYYINTYNGNLWKCIKVDENRYTFTYVATFARQLDEVLVTTISPYTDNSGKWTQNSPTGSFTMTDSEWNLKFGIPSAPLIAVAKDLTLVGAMESDRATVKGEITDKNTYTLNFSLPKASTWYVGENLIDINSQNVLPGDFFLETISYDIYNFQKTGGWTKVGNIMGATGPTSAINITDYFSYTYIDSITTEISKREYQGNLDIENSAHLQQFGDIAESLIDRTLTSTELISIIYTKDNESNSYWLYQTTNGGWDAMRVTGNAAAVSKNIVTIKDSINPLGGEFSVIDIGKNIDNNSKIDFQINTDDDSLFDEVFSDMQKQMSDSQQSIENFKTEIINSIANSKMPTLNFTIPLKTSDEGVWSTTENGKIQVVLSIANDFVEGQEPIIILKNGNITDYNKIETIVFNSSSIVVTMTEENSQSIDLFAYFPSIILDKTL